MARRWAYDREDMGRSRRPRSGARTPSIALPKAPVAWDWWVPEYAYRRRKVAVNWLCFSPVTAPSIVNLAAIFACVITGSRSRSGTPWRVNRLEELGWSEPGR